MAMQYIKVYYDWIEVTQTLSDAERGRLINAIDYWLQLPIREFVAWIQDHNKLIEEAKQTRK